MCSAFFRGSSLRYDLAYYYTRFKYEHWNHAWLFRRDPKTQMTYCKQKLRAGCPGGRPQAGWAPARAAVWRRALPRRAHTWQRRGTTARGPRRAGLTELPSLPAAPPQHRTVRAPVRTHLGKSPGIKSLSPARLRFAESQESIRLEKIFEVIGPTEVIESRANNRGQPDHGSERHSQSFLEHLQGRCLHHHRGQPIPVPHQPFCEEIPPDSQPFGLLPAPPPPAQTRTAPGSGRNREVSV